TDLVVHRDSRDGRKVPGVRVEGVWKKRLDVGRKGTAVGRNRAAALVAIARVVLKVQILAAGLQVVTALGVVGQREVVVEVVDVLIAVSRQVVVPGEGKADERDPWPIGRDAVGGLPMLRPVCQTLLV